MLTGTIQAIVDGWAEQASAGDAIVVPVGAEFGADNLADAPATAWATTSGPCWRMARGSLRRGRIDGAGGAQLSGWCTGLRVPDAAFHLAWGESSCEFRTTVTRPRGAVVGL